MSHRFTPVSWLVPQGQGGLAGLKIDLLQKFVKCRNRDALSTVLTSPMTFRYRLIDEHGSDLGPLASPRSDWQPGEQLSRRHGETLEVVGVVDVDDEHRELFRAYIVVRHAG